MFPLNDTRRTINHFLTVRKRKGRKKMFEEISKNKISSSVTRVKIHLIFHACDFRGNKTMILTRYSFPRDIRRARRGWKITKCNEIIG